MKSHPLTILRLLAIGFIFACTAAAWFTLGSALLVRTAASDGALGRAVGQAWGRPLNQPHPRAWYASPTGEKGRRMLAPEASEVSVRLDYDPKQKGLLWYRTYWVQFSGSYRITNPAPIAQTIYAVFELPGRDTSYYDVSFQLGGGNASPAVPRDGVLTEAVVVPAGGSVPLTVAYRARGVDGWTYQFGGAGRIRNFRLEMTTNFREVDFPTASPTSRKATQAGGLALEWNYADIIGAQPISMPMPKVLNAGPVAARISFFAPVSLLFFFAVLLILGAVRGAGLHPMNYFFLAAGCFAFQLLFAYLVDVLPVHASFLIAAAVSLGLVSGYIHAVAGRALSAIALPAQFAYMVLFSYSFFFDGMSGLTITIGAIATLAILMLATARTDWSEKFSRRPRPAAPAAMT
jgi:hypothetical protein